MRSATVILLLALVVSPINADWWDNFTDSVSNGLTNAASWVKETASPAVRGKFNEYKEKLQDPETHRQVKEWLSEKADAASEFAQAEIIPELKKIYEAATADEAKTETSTEINIESTTEAEE